MDVHSTCFARRPWIPAVCLAIVACAGCSTPSPFAADSNRSPIAAAQPANGSTPAAVPNSPATQFASDPFAPSDRWPSFGDQFRSGFRNASTAVGDALEIKPRVVSAADPTSLSSSPPTVGSDLHYHAARVYESQQNTEGAISHYRKALEQSPQDTKVLISFGRLYDRQGQLDQARNLYQQALQVDPNNCAALNDLGICYAKQGETEAALETLNRAVQLQPQNKRYRNNIATVLLDAGRNDEAFGHLVAAHGPAGAHYNLGFLLSHRGQAAEARRQFEAALQNNPYLQEAHDMLATLDQATRANAPPAPGAAGAETARTGGQPAGVPSWQSRPAPPTATNSPSVQPLPPI